ncbi:hypothetical protein ATO12_24690 [Aquimarina atlantica]|uniref:Uncharacterized protein n=1 Tax=Aquimarina atlantica TaxID=1317122 RepID=A0A023BR27_9FLAO|nr:hypothetical protein [Aquimarina atlantica]EZH72138.1 hypothetical protein ATO12_24690 [Aquimarina atlantica]
MVLILSRESAEITTDVVMDWLHYYDVKYFRLNGEDLVNGKCIINFHLDDTKTKWYFTVQYEDIFFDSDMINAVWFRRSFDWDIEKRFWEPPSTIEHYKFLEELNRHHQSEIRAVYNLIEEVLKDKYWLNQPSKSGSDKFKVLKVAKQIGFKIPNTLITNNLNHLSDFIHTNKNCITKASKEGGLILGSDFGISTMTNKVTHETLLSLSQDFFTPSLFQKEIRKEFEIRVIYIENQIFATGIFSQSNEKTKVDYRHYDDEKPNRLQLISLPENLVQKIILLMERLQLNFGSIDIIKDINGHYYFLEINPVGQFLGISDVLGLKIEKIIAQILKENDEIKRIQEV